MISEASFRKGINREILLAIFKPLSPWKGGLRAYDLFALAVAIMMVSHADSYLANNESWWRIPDRITVSVFLVSIGYNSGQKPSRILWVGATLMTYSNWLLKRWIRLDILAMIILVRFIIDPMMTWALKSRVRFVGLNLVLLALYPITNRYGEYGSLALLMAMAGWINRNRGELPPNVVKPYEYFIFLYFAFLICTFLDHTFSFSIVQYLIIGAGLAWVMCLLYNFRQLLLNSIAARPRDIIEKICSFLGHKSLEIYVIHTLAFEFLVVIERIIS
jgi:hypothetical protein